MCLRYTLSDAIAMGVWLNVLVRQSRHLAMANLAQSVNVISPLMTTKTGIWKQATWWPLLLFSKYMRGSVILTTHHGFAWHGETSPAWIRESLQTPWLDVSAVLDRDGRVNLAVVNIHGSESFEVLIEAMAGRNVETFVVTGADVAAANTEDQAQVGLVSQEIRIDGTGLYTFPRLSVTLLRWAL